jgi:hypothetical protein
VTPLARPPEGETGRTPGVRGTGSRGRSPSRSTGQAVPPLAHVLIPPKPSNTKVHGQDPTDTSRRSDWYVASVDGLHAQDLRLSLSSDDDLVRSISSRPMMMMAPSDQPIVTVMLPFNPPTTPHHIYLSPLSPPLFFFFSKQKIDRRRFWPQGSFLSSDRPPSLPPPSPSLPPSPSIPASCSSRSNILRSNRSLPPMKNSLFAHVMLPSILSIFDRIHRGRPRTPKEMALLSGSKDALCRSEHE